MKYKFVKIVVYVPKDYADKIREVLAEGGAGKIGNYDYCSFSVLGVGRFRALKGADPFVGEEGVVEEVQEERIETIAPFDKYEDIIKAVKKVHPYEEPAIDVMPLLN